MAGNMTTPAGVFFTFPSGTYHGIPSWMRKTEKQVKENNPNGIPSAIHARDLHERANTNGCTGMCAADLNELKTILGETENIPTYILPSDPNNKFFIRNNQILFSSSNPNVSTYNTLTYNPIRDITYNTENFDDELLGIVNAFKSSLINNKKSLQKDLKINSDTYDLLAMLALGIIGKESNFGKSKGFLRNLLSTVGRVIGLGSAPDIYAKYKMSKDYDELQGHNSDNRSVGLALIRLTSLSPSTKKLFLKYNITLDDLVYDPLKAAVATMLKLADEYKRQGLSVEKAVKSWNASLSYYPSVLKLISDNGFTGYADYNTYQRLSKGGTLNYILVWKQLEQIAHMHKQ